MPFRGYKFLQIASWPMMLVWFLLYGMSISSRPAWDYELSLDQQFLQASRDYDVVRQTALLKEGANINARDPNNDDSTALIQIVHYDMHPACPGEHGTRNEEDALNAMRFLLKRGADPNLINSHGQSALTIADILNLQKATKLLRNNGAKSYEELRQRRP